MDWLRTPEDDRLEAQYRAEIIAEAARRPSLDGYVVGQCHNCGRRLALWTPTRCLWCHEDHEWAEGNRLICGFLHRDAPGRG